MFKENDEMRQGPTPERVLAICRLLEDRPCTQQELMQLLRLNSKSASEDAFRLSIGAARELEIVREKDGRLYLELEHPKEALCSAQAFRRVIAPIIFARSSSTFFKLTEWFISSSDEVLKLTRFEDFSAEASGAGLTLLTDRSILGWRLWMRYLGHAYQLNRKNSRTLIPNMYIRLKDAMAGIKTTEPMRASVFVAWLKEHVPEAAASCSNAQLPLAVSNGLRTLEHEGYIELISTSDAVLTSLYPVPGEIKNDFSDISFKKEMD